MTNVSRVNKIYFLFIPYGNRTRVFALKRRRPRPLDEKNQNPKGSEKPCNQQ